jgi:hypothetical protein
MCKKFPLIIFLISLGLLVACSANAEEAFPADAAYYSEADEEEAASFDSGAPNVAGAVVKTTFQAQDTQERLIIREGNMNVVVEDTNVSLAEFAKLAEGKGGWVVSSEVYDGGGGAKSGSITLRIPVEQFEATMSTIRKAVVEVDSESTSSQDVTEEFVDLDARVGNLEATADRVRSFLDESRNVEEALEVNRELSRLEGEIESLKARMKYLSQSAAFSLLVVTLTPDELSQPLEIAGWRPEGVARDAFEALLSTLESLGSVAIWSGVFCLPLLLIFGIPAFLIARYFYRRRRRGEEVEPPSDAPAIPGPVSVDDPEEAEE